MDSPEIPRLTREQTLELQRNALVKENEGLRASLQEAESRACPHCLDLALKICDYQSEISKQHKRIVELSASLQELDGIKKAAYATSVSQEKRITELSASLQEKDRMWALAKDEWERQDAKRTDLEAELARYRGTSEVSGS